MTCASTDVKLIICNHISINAKNLVNIGPVRCEIIGLKRVPLREETGTEQIARSAGRPAGLQDLCRFADVSMTSCHQISY